MTALDLRGLVPAPVTPFTREGEVGHAAIRRLGSSIPCSTSMAPRRDMAPLRPNRLSNASWPARLGAIRGAIHDRLLPVTRSVYHRGSHMEAAVALKHGHGILDHATVRLPLLPLEAGAEVEIAKASRFAGLIAQTPAGSGEVGERPAA